MTGKLKFKLANSALGAIITQALVNEEGTHGMLHSSVLRRVLMIFLSAVVAAESGELLYWDIRSKKVIFKDRQEDIQQIFFYKNQTRCVVVSKQGTRGNKEFLLIISLLCCLQETSLHTSSLAPSQEERSSGSLNTSSRHLSRSS